ncbi:MAG: nuclear transport factor 2 family protein [Verrucomicrobiales bacterium]|nr:nuclear transport factor 2 family protein [Verrucomicrobiales bacterium]
MTRSLLRAAVALLLLPLLPSACNKALTSPEEPAVRKLIEHYFASWSDQEMDAYAACFQPEARITYLPDRGGDPRTDSLSDFLYGQRMGHKTSPEKMVEIPTAIHIQMQDRGAQALVRWKLTKGKASTTGTDLFQLIQTSRGWKIIHLVFYSDT